MANSVYKEEQKFPLWIYLLILIPFVIIFTLSAISFFEKNYSDLMGLSFALLVMTVINLLIFFSTLKTKINEEGIHIKFKPFTNRKILWEEIESAEIVKYGFVGYGWRISLKYGRVYNTKGNKGLFIKKKNKQKILLGTQQSEKLKQAISQYQIKSE